MDNDEVRGIVTLADILKRVLPGRGRRAIAVSCFTAAQSPSAHCQFGSSARWNMRSWASELLQSGKLAKVGGSRDAARFPSPVQARAHRGIEAEGAGEAAEIVALRLGVDIHCHRRGEIDRKQAAIARPEGRRQRAAGPSACSLLRGHLDVGVQELRRECVGRNQRGFRGSKKVSTSSYVAATWSASRWPSATVIVNSSAMSSMNPTPLLVHLFAVEGPLALVTRASMQERGNHRRRHGTRACVNLDEGGDRLAIGFEVFFVHDERNCQYGLSPIIAPAD